MTLPFGKIGLSVVIVIVIGVFAFWYMNQKKESFSRNNNNKFPEAPKASEEVIVEQNIPYQILKMMKKKQ